MKSVKNVTNVKNVRKLINIGQTDKNEHTQSVPPSLCFHLVIAERSVSMWRQFLLNYIPSRLS